MLSHLEAGIWSGCRLRHVGKLALLRQTVPSNFTTGNKNSRITGMLIGGMTVMLRQRYSLDVCLLPVNQVWKQ